jgi:hypothetical protein
MSLLQIAKLLEIIGFSLATFFGGILLNKEFFSKPANSISNKLTSAKDRLNKRYIPYIQYLLRIKWHERIGGTVVITFAEICIVLGLLIDITWLFWLGLLAISPYVIFIVPFSAFMLFRNDPRMESMWQFPAYLIGALMRSFIIAPIVLIPSLAFLYFLATLMLILNAIAKEDFAKKALIISGSIIVIIGLTLELIAIF